VFGTEAGANGAGIYSQMFSGRPGTQSVEDFKDRLLAAYTKARSKKYKKLTKGEFLLQLPGVLEHEALQLWCKKRDDNVGRTRRWGRTKGLKSHCCCD
jgi:hypothetical protein